MATIQVVLLNGTTADANQVMSNFYEIYGNINNSNIANGAGIVFSKLDATTVAGVTATQTLTNKTLTNPIINGGTFSNFTFTGANVFSSTHFTGDFNLWNSSNISVFSDSGSTLKFRVNGTTGDTSIPTTARFNLNGISGSDFITNSSAGVNELWSNGIKTLFTDTSGNTFINHNLYMANGGQVNLGTLGSGDYIVASAPGQVDLTANNTLVWRTDTSGNLLIDHNIGMTMGGGVYLDGIGGNDYIISSANGQNDIYAAGTLALRTGTGGTVSIPNGAVNITNTLTVGSTILPVTNAAQNVGSGAAAFANYYVTNQIIYGTNTAKNIDFTTSTEITFNGGDISIPSGKKLIMNGAGGNTSISFQSGVSWDVIISGNLAGGFVITPTGATISNFFLLSQPSGGGTNTIYNVLVGPLNSGPGSSGRALYIAD